MFADDPAVLAAGLHKVDDEPMADGTEADEHSGLTVADRDPLDHYTAARSISLCDCRECRNRNCVNLFPLRLLAHRRQDR